MKIYKGSRASGGSNTKNINLTLMRFWFDINPKLFLETMEPELIVHKYPHDRVEAIDKVIDRCHENRDGLRAEEKLAPRRSGGQSRAVSSPGGIDWT